MKYWRIWTTDDTLPFYACADNAQQAIRKVENQYGPLPPQRTKSVEITPESVPEGDDVIDEPEQDREERTDGEEKEDPG